VDTSKHKQSPRYEWQQRSCQGDQRALLGKRVNAAIRAGKIDANFLARGRHAVGNTRCPPAEPEAQLRPRAVYSVGTASSSELTTTVQRNFAIKHGRIAVQDA
jgi:hypothetical protein